MTRKPPLPSWGYYVLGLLAGLGIGLSIGSARAQVDTTTWPVVMSLELSHDVAIPGQKIWATWKPTKGSTLITRCELTQSPEGLPSTTTAVTKSRVNFDLEMPDAPVFRVSVTCWYPDANQTVTGEGSVMAGDLVERTTRETILSGIENGPDCYPAPLGTGSKVYGASYRDPDGKDSSCVLWFCDDTPRSFCFRWDLADWSIAALAAVKDFAGLDEKWKTAPWHSTSTQERALVAALFNENRPRYYAARNSSYTTRPVYARKEDGTRGALVSTARVAVGDECDCTQRAVYGSSRYCSVAGRANALRPAEILPGSDTVSGGSFALCASL